MTEDKRHPDYRWTKKDFKKVVILAVAGVLIAGIALVVLYSYQLYSQDPYFTKPMIAEGNETVTVFKVNHAFSGIPDDVKIDQFDIKNYQENATYSITSSTGQVLTMRGLQLCLDKNNFLGNNTQCYPLTIVDVYGAKGSISK